MQTHYQTILFDLDGTLIDHFNTLYRCYVHTTRSIGNREPSYEEVRRAVGGSMEQTIREFVTEDQFIEAVNIFWRFFEKTFLDDVTVLPGGQELLEALSRDGKTLGVYTNKQGKASRTICEQTGLSPFLKAVFGAHDTPWRKPEAEFTRHVIGELSAQLETTCLVGDSPFDIATARNGGISCYCVATGTHSALELKEAGADGVFTDLAELGEAVFGVTTLRLPSESGKETA